ncbi:MAG: hypothetical protein K0R57_5318 [Paenibacillaceae bacterium]|jgi:2-dehydropantoate 2-reductase|nr:hypothetical protein [Paenibacillaceae bacterium]
MRIDCIGGGSLGLLLSARLARLPVCIRLITRTAEQARFVSTDGLALYEAGDNRESTTPGRVRLDCISFERYLEEADSDPLTADWVLLTVKQKDVDDRMLQTLRLRVGSGTAVCCFQNGLGHMERLSRVIDSAKLYTAVTTEGARRISKTEVRHTGLGFTWVGQEAGSAAPSPDKQEELVRVLCLAGFSAGASTTMDTVIWSKLVMNTVINPVTAILELPNGALLQSSDALSLMKRLYEEAAGLAEVLGVALDGDLWDRLLGVCRATAENRSSMLQDLERGRRTELEWLNGSLLKLAGQSNIPLPAHETVYRLVKIKEELRTGGEANRAGGATDV